MQGLMLELAGCLVRGCRGSVLVFCSGELDMPVRVRSIADCCAFGS